MSLTKAIEDSAVVNISIPAAIVQIFDDLADGEKIEIGRLKGSLKL